MLPVESPSRVSLCVRVGVRALSLTGLPVVTPYIYVCLVSIAQISCGFCVLVGVRGSAIVFALRLPLFGYSSVQDLRGPALVSPARAE